MRPEKTLLLILLANLWLGPETRGQTNPEVIVAYSTANPTPLNQGFAGFATEMLGTGIEYGDTNMQHYASMLSPGWVLYPSGTTGDAFDWSSGLTDTNWVNTLAMREDPNNNAASLAGQTYWALRGKSGAQFTNFASMAANLGGAKIIVCVNGFTDNPNSAGAFAAFALSNHIPVAAWELCNEPYLFQNGTNAFFPTGADYANQMKPFRDAIKAANSNAVVAVFFSDPSRTGQSWDKALSFAGHRRATARRRSPLDWFDQRDLCRASHHQLRVLGDPRQNRVWPNQFQLHRSQPQPISILPVAGSLTAPAAPCSGWIPGISRLPHDNPALSDHLPRDNAQNRLIFQGCSRCQKVATPIRNCFLRARMLSACAGEGRLVPCRPGYCAHVTPH